MRVIAGEAGGVRLGNVPPGVRPTSDRVRESLFGSLGQFFDGGSVLDLYAGTGSLGIEALSRGCERATFVEKNGRAVAAVRENLCRAGFEERAEVLRDDVGRALGEPLADGRQYNLIFLDPPYRIAAAEAGGLLGRLCDLLAPGGRVVVESDAPVESGKGERGVARRYGGTLVTTFERHELMMNVAVCPGSFDPVTTGHLDIIQRAAGIYDHIVVAVGQNLRKEPHLPAVERARMIEKVTGEMENVSVEVMNGLLVDFAREQNARVVVKGLRAVTDFMAEFEQVQLNRKLHPELETVFIMASSDHSFLSSSAVREIIELGGDVRGLVPDGIMETITEMYSDNREIRESDRG